MASSRPKSIYWRGVRDGLPFVLVVGPFALLFGVVATEAGLNVAQTLGFSVLVIAGASQFAALQLMAENAPTLIVVLTALAVNLRMAMYSAALAPHLGDTPFWQKALIAYLNVDQSFAVGMAKYEREPTMTTPEKASYFLGAVSPIILVWYTLTLVGALVGNALPDWLALDFALPITFIAIIAPMVKTLAHLAAAVTSVVLALMLVSLPFSSGLLVAGLGAMCVGAAVETWMERRA